MLQTYEGTLCGNRIDWKDEVPPAELPRRVFVTILSETRQDNQLSSEQAIDFLKKVSRTNPFAAIHDPMQWQIDIRQDRPLPGRQ